MSATDASGLLTHYNCMLKVIYYDILSRIDHKFVRLVVLLFHLLACHYDLIIIGTQWKCSNS